MEIKTRPGSLISPYSIGRKGAPNNNNIKERELRFSGLIWKRFDFFAPKYLPWWLRNTKKVKERCKMVSSQEGFHQKLIKNWITRKWLPRMSGWPLWIWRTKGTTKPSTKNLALKVSPKSKSNNQAIQISCTKTASRWICNHSKWIRKQETHNLHLLASKTSHLLYPT